MPYEILPGALVECSDGPLGTVEEVLVDERCGEGTAILVRHGRADYLLCVPDRYIISVSPWRVLLKARFDDVEISAIERGRAEANGEDITDGGPTEPSPYEEELLGQVIGGSPVGGPATS
ncbi:MAG: hypothetical protein HYU88_00470 [Chloroflexi bacterium]|nr:hypothetical protein [Chloroflexota bacterium]MBI4504911.1 hypothetical protein [Chloroflexota bacterium]